MRIITDTHVRCFDLTLVFYHLGREKLVELLLREGANINTKNNLGLTPLHLAVRAGKLILK